MKKRQLGLLDKHREKRQSIIQAAADDITLEIVGVMRSGGARPKSKKRKPKKISSSDPADMLRRQRESVSTVAPPEPFTITPLDSTTDYPSSADIEDINSMLQIRADAIAESRIPAFTITPQDLPARMTPGIGYRIQPAQVMLCRVLSRLSYITQPSGDVLDMCIVLQTSVGDIITCRFPEDGTIFRDLLNIGVRVVDVTFL
jgi:hypothetical protein